MHKYAHRDAPIAIVFFKGLLIVGLLITLQVRTVRLTSTSVRVTHVIMAAPASTNQMATPVTVLLAGSVEAVRSVSLC